MNKVQAAHYDSFQATRSYLAAHSSEWNGLAPFVAAEAIFQSLLEELNEANARHLADNSGATEQKAKRRKALSDSLLALASALSVLAGVTNNYTLELTVHISRTDLDRLTDDAFRGRAHRILRAAAPHVAALAPYGFTPAQVAAVEALFESWCDAEILCIDVRGASVRATRDVARVIARLSTHLTDTMDRLVVILGATNRGFADGWAAVRALVDPATRTRSATVRVVAMEDGVAVPVAGAVAVINPGNVRKITGAEGMFYVQKLPAGSFTLDVMKAGYEPLAQLAFTVAKGKMTSVEAVMDRAEG